jgi:hypothetical protein
MQYRNRRTRWGVRGFPWIPFFFILFFTHSWVGFMISIVILVLLYIIMQAIFAASTGRGNQYATPMANQQPHEELYQQPYQPYQQGYQPMPMTYHEVEQQSQYPRPQPEYEQPQVSYPEGELPPMEQ